MIDTLGLNDNQKKELISTILEKEKTAEQIREYFLPRWKAMILAELGEFMLQTDRFGQLQVMEEILATDDNQAIEKRPFFNIQLMRRIWLQHADAYLSIPPYFVANPASSEISDIIASQIGQQIADGIISPKLDAVRLDLLWWSLWVDTTFLKVGVSDEKEILLPLIVPEEAPVKKRPLMLKTEVGEVYLRENGKILYQQLDENDNPVFRKGYYKDLLYRIIPPNEILIDPTAKGMNCLLNPKDPYAVKWFSHEINLDKEELEKLDLDPKEYYSKDAVAVDPTGLDVLKVLGFQEPKSTSKIYPYREFYQLPNKKFPQGLRVTHIGDKIISITELPCLDEDKPRLPIVDFRDSVRANALFSKTILADARYINVEVCNVFSKIRNLVEQYGDKTAFAKMGGELMVHPVTGMGSLKRIVDVEYGQMPQIVSLDEIPMFYIRYLDLLFQLMEHITATYQVKYPQRTGRTAYEIAQIIKENESAQSVTSAVYKSRLCYAAELGLAVIKNYYLDDQLIEITGGMYSTQEIFLYKKTNLLSGKFNYSITVGQIPLTTRIGRLTWIKELLSIPHVAQVINPNTILNLLNMHELTETAIGQADTRRATQENINYFTDPEYQAVVEKIDDDTIHIDTHTNFIKINYRILLPEVIQSMYKHIEEHEQQRLQKLEFQRQQMAMLSGGTNAVLDKNKTG